MLLLLIPVTLLIGLALLWASVALLIFGLRLRVSIATSIITH